MPNAVIAGYARSPFHLAGKGALARTRPDDLAAAVIKGLVQRTGVSPEAIEDLIVGCAFPEGEQGFNVARLIGMIAGLPRSVGGMTVNRFCGSSMSAIHYAVGQIAAGSGDVFIAAGVESMSRVPMMGFNPLPNPALAKVSQAYIGMGDTAENLASQYGLRAKRRKPLPWPARTRPPRPSPPASWRTRSCRSRPRPVWSTPMAARAPAPRRRPLPGSSLPSAPPAR
jgi:acetyl-CoA acyltransferase